MSFIFSQALVEASSLDTCLDTDASAPSSASPTPKPSLWHAKTMEPSRLSRYGMTCEPLTESRGQDLLTWWLLDFLAKTSPPQAREPGSTGSKAASGEKYPASWLKFDHERSSWKTAQLSLAGDLEEFSGTWPRWGFMRDGECWELDMSGLPTSVNGFGSLPTPSGTSNHGKNHVCGRLDEWGGSSNPWRGTEIGKTSSPAFEEWVMGWPVQWTELTASAMARFQQWLQLHGDCSPVSERFSAVRSAIPNEKRTDVTVTLSPEEVQTAAGGYRQ